MKFIISNIVIISIFTTIIIHFLFFLKERISTNNKIKDVHEKIRDIRHDHKNTQGILKAICYKLNIETKVEDINQTIKHLESIVKKRKINNENNNETD